MRCYYVLVHGSLEWKSPPSSAGETQPRGFHCFRFVLAGSQQQASAIALDRVRRNLAKRYGWLRDGAASVALEAEEIREAPLLKLLAPENRAHVFYKE